jgi:hypothetical protein
LNPIKGAICAISRPIDLAVADGRLREWSFVGLPWAELFLPRSVVQLSGRRELHLAGDGMRNRDRGVLVLLPEWKQLFGHLPRLM